METKEKEKIVKTLTEEKQTIKVGKFSFQIKPVTLAQIYEMAVPANKIQSPNWGTGTKVNIIREMFKHGGDAQLMCEIFIICAFRNKLWRKVCGGYIRRHLNIVAFNELIQYLSASFNANFFLTSIIFLTQTKIMTEPKKTTRHGQ